MTSENDPIDEIYDGIQKANDAWETFRGELPCGDGINVKLRLMLFDELITSILLYGLRIIPINKGSINKSQQFHKKCIRIDGQ